MREWIPYIGEIMLITAISGMIYHLAPEGAMKKHLHFILSLCVLISLAFPLFSIVNELPSIFDKTYEDIGKEQEDVENELLESVISVSKKEIEEAIVSYIAGKYDISPAGIIVSLTLDESRPEAIEISSMDVSISSISSAKAGEIQWDLSQMFLGKTEVIVH